MTESEKKEAAVAVIPRKAVAEVLRYVIDPEIGVNIVDLGLVYDIHIEVPKITVQLTMTTPACPLSGHISREVRSWMKRVRGVEEVEIDLVWNPPWNPGMMDPDVAALQFGGGGLRIY